MNAVERANAIIHDILVNHLPRIKEGLEKGYVDENQILVMYDHAVRARILREHAGLQPEGKSDLQRNLELRASHSQDEHEDALSRIEAELAAAGASAAMDYPSKTNEHGVTLGSERAAQDYSKVHVEKHECVCGGLIHDLPTGIETMLECEQCKRTFLDEFELAEARKTQRKIPQKCPDATYWTTGTLAGGVNPVPIETEINLNGRKTVIKATNGKFILSYEQIVRMAVNQERGGHLNAFTGSDAELPHWTTVYSHRVPFNQLPGERSGSLYKGKSVECTPGMSITCISTSNA